GAAETFGTGACTPLVPLTPLVPFAPLVGVLALGGGAGGGGSAARRCSSSLCSAAADGRALVPSALGDASVGLPSPGAGFLSLEKMLMPPPARGLYRHNRRRS